MMTEFPDAQPASPRNSGIRGKIFSTSEAEFFFINKAYLNTYIQLRGGIRRHGGLFVLIGEAGMGKTLLLRKLANEAPGNIRSVFCYATHLDYNNLLAVISNQLGIVAYEQHNLANKLAALKEYLNSCAVQGMSVALLIDDAHHLGAAVLNDLIALPNLALAGNHRLRIVLSGTPALEETLQQTRIAHDFQTDFVHAHLEPLTVNEVATFISRQMQSAGAVDSLFSVLAIEKITRYTGGIPRLINTLCERALLITQLNGEAAVSIASIDEAASELMLKEGDMPANTVIATSPEAILVDDTILLAQSGQPAAPDADKVRQETEKKPIEGLLVDELGADLDETVNESILQDMTAYPVTAVSYGAAHSGHANSLVQSGRPSAWNKGNLTEEARKKLVESLLMDEFGTSSSMVTRPSELQAERKRSRLFHSVRLQTILLIFFALLAGLLGGIGSIYLFQPPPIRTLATPTIPEPETPAPPRPVSITGPAAGHDQGSGSTQVAAVESPAAPVLTPAPASTRPGPSVEPGPVSITGSPGTRLELPAVPAPIAETTPPVAQTRMLPASPPPSAEPAPETPVISSYMSSGNELLAQGDVASARLFYEAAAKTGFAAAMTAVGKTYDPVILNQLGIRGFRADPLKAAEWYLKAEKAGDPETVERLEKLRDWLSDGSGLRETEANALRELLR